MKQSNVGRQVLVLIIALLALMTLAWQLGGGVGQPAVGRVANVTPSDSQSPIANRQSPILVVRAYFTDREAVNRLAAWKEPWEVHYDKGYVVVDVTPDEINLLQLFGFRLEVDEALTAEYNRPRRPLPDQGGGIPGYGCYRTVEETFDSAAQLAADYPAFATWTDIGDSWEKTQNPAEGYDMMALKLTNSAIAGPKPALLLTGAIHAREYTTAETATRFAEHLLQNYDVDPDVTWLLDYHEINLILQTNPDGRKQAETGLLWRKNANNNYCSDTNTRGADLNRNFEFQWGCCGGSSGVQCSETYRGASAASEPETQAAQAYMTAIFPDQRDPDLGAAAPITSTGVYIDLHSYAQEILWPFGFADAPNHLGLQTLARKMGYFNGYAATQSLYTTDGTTKDFAYGEFGVAAYTIEMGTSFFQDCGSFENTIYPDNLQTLLYAAKAARQPYVIPAGPDAVDVALASAAVASGDVVTITATINDTRYDNSQGVEPTQDIAAAEFYVDTPFWITDTTPVPLPLLAVDGSFDDPLEAVEATLDTTGLANGRHTLFVRGQDAAGNWGAVSAVFLTIEPKVVAPTAGFTSSSPDLLGETTVFTNTSTGPNLAFLWDFGDGSPTSTEMNPTHVYGASGVYNVTLTATNGLGSDVAMATVEIMAPPEDEWEVYLPFVR